MSRRCRLIKPAIINGVHCRPGHEFTLGDRYRVVKDGVTIVDTSVKDIAAAEAKANDAKFEAYPDPGPCDHVLIRHDRVDVNNDNVRLIGEVKAVPLYVELAPLPPGEPDSDIPTPHIISRMFSKKK